jgi:hypothetical protein
LNDGILEAARVLQVQVKSTVLGLLGGRNFGADKGLELIETIGDDLLSMVSGRSISIEKGTHTVLSGVVLVETEPWGQPLPEYAVSMMVIWFGSGPALLPWGLGRA